MIDVWDRNIRDFIASAEKVGVKMIMVGGGAVNFYGYQRHSADVDFWIKPSAENFEKLLQVFQSLNFDVIELPKEVLEGQKNISLKFSPESMYIELITNFSVNRAFDEAYFSAKTSFLVDEPSVKWRVLCFEDLITSKIKSSRPKDLIDIQELKRINKQ